MPQTLEAPATYSSEDFLSEHNLQLSDETVAELFSMMLGLPLEVVPPTLPVPEGNRKTAIVGFSGAMRGSCELRLSSLASRTLAAAMLGEELAEDTPENESAAGDAVGELCNMIAGGWKNRIDSLSSACSLSPPTIISGCDYHVKLGSPCFKFSRSYRFADQTMEVTMQYVDGPRG